MVSGRDQPLCCEVVADELIVRIGIDTLVFADKERREYESGQRYRITSVLGFAEDVARELNREEENGATPLTDLLDAAMDRAIECGSQFVEVEE